jgi:hypothetical protein
MKLVLFVVRFTAVRRSDSVSKYLEAYTQKRLRIETPDPENGCFWSR